MVMPLELTGVFFGPTDTGKATFCIMSHSSNHDSPQRVRIWSDKSHNGAIFFNYVPAQENLGALSQAQLQSSNIK